MQTGTTPNLHTVLAYQITSQLGACDVAVTEDADLIAYASALFFHDLMIDVFSLFIMNYLFTCFVLVIICFCFLFYQLLRLFSFV